MQPVRIDQSPTESLIIHQSSQAVMLIVVDGDEHKGIFLSHDNALLARDALNEAIAAVVQDALDSPARSKAQLELIMKQWKKP